MSKFNKTAAPVTKKTRSKDGVVAYKQTDRIDLCERVLTCFYGEDRFYESAGNSTSELQRLIRVVANNDPVFVAKLAVLAREHFNLRSVSQVLIAELSRIHRGDALVSVAMNRIAKRPDDMIETIAYLLQEAKPVSDIDGRTKHTNKRIPNQIKKGIGSAFTKFDEYQLSKYRASTKSLKLRDVLALTRPTPKNDDQSALWGRLMRDELKTADTWETSISKTGQVAKNDDGTINKEKQDLLKSDAWESKIMTSTLPYMAALRNIRNIIEAGVSDAAHIRLQGFLSNEKAVLGSKQLPFRFYSAYKALLAMCDNDSFSDPFTRKKTGELIGAYAKALSRALYYSGKNIPKLKGRTIIITDLSGSMNNLLSADSTVTYKEVGAVLSTLAGQFCEEFINIGFGTDMALIEVDGNVDSTLNNIDMIKKINVGHNTNASQIFDYLIKHNIKVDNFLIFTDTQLNGRSGYISGDSSFDTSVRNYRSNYKDAYIYQINLAGYGSTQLDPNNSRNVFMTGWSDATLKYITEYQQVRNGIVDMVNNVKLEY